MHSTSTALYIIAPMQSIVMYTRLRMVYITRSSTIIAGIPIVFVILIVYMVITVLLCAINTYSK